MPKLNVFYQSLVIAAQAHKGKHRYAIDTVAIYPDGTAVVTDGCGLLAVAPHSGEPKAEGAPFLLDAATANTALSLWDEKSRTGDMAVAAEVDTDAMTINVPWRAKPGDTLQSVTLALTAPHGTYPKWPAVVPPAGNESDAAVPKTAYRMSALFLRRMLDAILAMHTDPEDEEIPVVLSFASTTCDKDVKLRVDAWLGECRQHVVGVLMGMVPDGRE
jgi:hypothetical protein